VSPGSYDLPVSARMEGHGLAFRLRSAPLMALASAICSGVLTSGSDTRTFCLARDTWRLCRFASLLSILPYPRPLSIGPVTISVFSFNSVDSII